jgi:hypothetical protein
VRPSNIHARITLARAYLADEQWRKAIDTIDDAAYWPCMMLKGDRLRRAGRSEEAQVVFETGQLTAPYVPSFYLLAELQDISHQD